MLCVKLEEKRKRTYVRVSNGSLIVKMGVDRFNFDTIRGAVTGVEFREHNVNGKQFKCWHLAMKDLASGEVYDVSFNRGCSAFRGIMRCLASEQGLTGLDDITIEVYKASRGNFTNAIVYAHGTKLYWTPGDIPPILYTAVGERNVPDDTLRINWLLTPAEMVNDAAGKQAGSPEGRYS